VDAQPLHDAVLVERVPARRQLPRRQPVAPYRGKADRALLIAADAVNALLGLGNDHGRELDAAARLLAPRRDVAGGGGGPPLHPLLLLSFLSFLKSVEAQANADHEQDDSGQPAEAKGDDDERGQLA
jgi:hypothetical protein